MKITIKQLKSLIREAGPKKKTKTPVRKHRPRPTLAIPQDKVVRPDSLRKGLSASPGDDFWREENALQFAQFLSDLAKTAAGKWLVYHGGSYTYMLNPNNLLDVTASDGSKMSGIEYLSDLGEWDSFWYELMFDMDPDTFGDYVRVSSRPVDQESHETGRMRGDF